MIMIALVAGLCVLLLILGFVAPRWSSRPQRKLDKGLEKADETAGGDESLPRRMAHRSTHMSKRAVDASTETGRKARRQTE